MLTNIVHRWADIQKLADGEKVFPHFVDFHTSNQCNHKCLGCAYGSSHTPEMMPEAKHAEAVIMFMAHGVKAFDFAGGGEPTLLPYLSSIMDLIAISGGHFGLITNGSNLTDDIVNALLRSGTYLRVSLEASSPWMFTKYKGVSPIEFGRIIDRLRDIVKQRDADGSKLQIGIKFGVGKSLRGFLHYQMMFNLANHIGVDRMTAKCLSHAPEELSAEERYAEYTLFMGARPISHPYRIVDSFIPVRNDDVPKCWLNPLHTTMDHKGNIYLCCYYYYREERHLIGNIFETPFEEMWMSRDHRRKIGAIERAECAKVDCKFFNHHKAVDSAKIGGQIHFL